MTGRLVGALFSLAGMTTGAILMLEPARTEPSSRGCMDGIAGGLSGGFGNELSFALGVGMFLVAGLGLLVVTLFHVSAAARRREQEVARVWLAK